jgi:L-asparaginase
VVPRIRIAHLAGPTATIQNTPPLVTSNKARAKLGLPPLTNPDGTAQRFDALRAQRLAAPATVYVEQFSAHPLEADAANLYGPPDGYIDASGAFSKERSAPEDRPVYEIEIRPEDGLYPLPYVATQIDGSAWEEECAAPGAPEEKARQGFFPDGSRSFEEIDRLSVTDAGTASIISQIADVDFFRVTPPSGFTKGLAKEKRADVGDGDIAPEVRGRDFFPYKPFHLPASPPRPALARTTNVVQDVLSSGDYEGAIWTQGSPQIEETAYWLNLLIDTTLPICGNAAQRPQGQISADGPKNIVDSVQFIASRVWADSNSQNRAGIVVIQEQQIFAAREVMKVDARPGGYVATGFGGVLGGFHHQGWPVLQYVPTTKHTYLSDVKLSSLPASVPAVRSKDGRRETFEAAIKDADGRLLEGAIPSVSIVKDGSYASDEFLGDASAEVDLLALVAHKLGLERLGGFVVEGLTPYGSMTSEVRQSILQRATYCGLPVVRVPRGNATGLADPHPDFIAGSNLTSTKARMLLMAALMKLGSLPPARDPNKPTAAELTATRAAVASYQEIFDTH